MMAETLVKNRVCGACGVEVRSGTFFCYNCGSSVTGDAASSDRNGKNDERGKTDNVLSPENISADEKTPVVENNKTGEQNNGEVIAGEKPKLKSAASMREKPKTIQRKRIEVVWE